MAPLPHYIDVDLKRNTNYKVFSVTQNDTDVVFIVRVTDNGLGSDALLDNFTTITLTSVRPKDKKAFYVAGEKIAGTNEVSFSLGTSELANTGKVEASVQLYSTDGRMSTAHFTYEVRKDHTGEYVPSENEATLIETVLVDGPTRIAEAQAATEAATTATANLETDKSAALAEMSTATEGANTAASNADSERVRMVEEVTQVVTDVDELTTYIQDDFLVNTAKAISDMDLVVQENATVANDAKTTAEGVEAQFNLITSEGPVQSVNGQTGIINGLALQSDLNTINAQLAETAIEARRKKEPEDLSDRTLALVTGGGTVNVLSVPQKDSVTLEKMTPYLRMDLYDLFDNFIDENGYWSVNLFPYEQVKQGGIGTGGTFSTSLTRTHAFPIKVESGKKYMIHLQENTDFIVRNLAAFKDGVFKRFILTDHPSTKELTFEIRDDENQIGISFAKLNLSATVTVEETKIQNISLLKVVPIETNLLNNSVIVQGSVAGEGGFMDSLIRTRIHPVPTKPLSIYELKVDVSSGIYIRNASFYREETFVKWVARDGLYTEIYFSVPEDGLDLAISFSKENTNSNITPEETKLAKSTLKEVY